MTSTGCEKLLEWRKAPKYLVPRMKQIYVRVYFLGSGSQVLSNGREQSWSIPSAPFRDGRGIFSLPFPTNIFTKEKRALWVYIWSFPSWPVNLPKCRVCPELLNSESAEFALGAGELLCWEQLCGGFALWARAGTQKVKSSFQSSPPQAASLRTAAEVLESLGCPELLSHSIYLEMRLFLPWEQLKLGTEVRTSQGHEHASNNYI